MSVAKEWVLRGFDVQGKNGGRIRVSETPGRRAVRLEIVVPGAVQVTTSLAVELTKDQWDALCELQRGWGDHIEVEAEPEMVTQIRAAGLDNPDDIVDEAAVDLVKANGSA